VPLKLYEATPVVGRSCLANGRAAWGRMGERRGKQEKSKEEEEEACTRQALAHSVQ